MQIEGNLIDVVKGEIYPAKITFTEKIKKIEKNNKKYNNYICPGFIDSHIRIEDSYLNPVEYTKNALLSGVTTVIEDITGYLTEGGHKTITYLISEFKKLPINFFYLYPINISQNEFESKPYDLDHENFHNFIENKHCLGLTQVDNIAKLKEKNHSMTKKIELGKNLNKPIISNVPKINFNDTGNMAHLGIRADLGSNIYQEAFEKACFGLKIKIVEGTKRKTLNNLIRLAKQFETTIVSEEKSPQEMKKGYLSNTIKRAINLGLDPLTAIKNVTINPANLLGLEEGRIEEGNVANILELDDLKSMNVVNVYYKGKKVVSNSNVKSLKSIKATIPKNPLLLNEVWEEDLEIKSIKKEENAKVIVFENDNTSIVEKKLPVKDGKVCPKNCNKVVVANKYGDNTVSIGFVQGFDIVKGGLGTTINGSSGNIIAIGSDDRYIASAINSLKDAQGGMAIVSEKKTELFSLPIYGVTSDKSCDNVIKELKKVNFSAKKTGCKLKNPFERLGSLMNLRKNSYRLTDKGLINSDKKEIINILEE
ncbi:MAG: adenine deaminase C-terminal domain-containing protein [Nanobdellota archaeon]